MGIDGIEFHPGYHQNLGTFSGFGFFRFFCLKLAPPPWSNHVLKMQQEIHFLDATVQTDVSLGTGY